MSAYRVGYCVCCDDQIMVQDTNGRWNSFKSNFRQADISFEDGHRVRVMLCEDCLGEPNFQKIYDSLTGEGSASGEAAIAATKKRGVPVSIKLANTIQGVRIGN